MNMQMVKKLLRGFTWTCLFFSIGSTAWGGEPAAPKGQANVAPVPVVMLRVGTRELMVRDYMEFLGRNPTLVEQAANTIEGKKQALRLMVEEELLRQAMREAGLISATPTPEEETAGLKELAKMKFPLPMAPGEQAVRDFYDKNQSEFNMPKNIRLSQIHFRVPPSATVEERAAVRARAEKALERIQAGEPFAKVADELTENPRGKGHGGDVGLVWMDDEWLVKALDGIQVGQHTGVVEAPHKFDILLLTEVNEAQITPFDEVKQSISRHLRVTEQAQLRQAYLRSLREQLPVVLVLENLKEEFPNGLFE